MTTPARKTLWTFIQVIYVLSSVLQFPVARGTLTPDGTVLTYIDRPQTFTCNVTGVEAVWTIKLGRITASESTGLSVANNSRITTTDTSGVTSSSTITITGFTAVDEGRTIQCINKEDGSVQGTATITIDALTPDGIVPVYCDGSQTFTCSGFRKPFRWNITGLRGIDTPEELLDIRVAAINNDRMTSTDSGQNAQFGISDITISGFSAADNGGTIQCINLEDGSVQGTATISIKSFVVPFDQAAVRVPVLEGKRAIFTCKLNDNNADDHISWSLTSAEGVHTEINPNPTNVNGSSVSSLSLDRTQLLITGVQNSLNGTRVECSPASANAAPICTETVYISVHNFTTVSPALIRKITLSSRLAVVIVWSVPGFVVDYIDGSVISVVMVTPNGPKAIRRTPVGNRVIAFAVDFPEKGARYHVTVHMTMNGLYSKPLAVELDV